AVAPARRKREIRRVVRRVVVFLALLTACGGAQKFQEDPKRAAAHAKAKGTEWLYELDMQTVGGTVIDPTDILPRLGLAAVAKGQRAIDEYQLQLDTARVAGVFQRLGYFAVDVKTRVDHRYPENKDAATLVFIVTPNKRATVHLEFFGLPDNVPLPKVRDAVPIKEGSKFDYDVYDATKEPLLYLLMDNGYAHARVEGAVIADRVHATATIRFVSDPGPHSTFGEISIQGVTEPMLLASLRARIKWSTGEQFSHKALVDTQTAIYGIGLFGSVRVEPSSDDLASVVPVKISVTSVTKNEASAGGGFALEPVAYAIRGRFTWTRHGVLTPLTTSLLDLRPEYAFETQTCSQVYLPWTCKRDFRGRIVETLTQQDLFLPDVRGDIEGGVDYRVYEAYSKLGAHVRLGLAKPWFERKLELRVGWQYQVNDFPSNNVDPATVQRLGIDHINYVGAYTGALVLDLRDSPISPTYGLYAEVRAAVGSHYALGQYDYLQVTPQVRGYLPLGHDYVLAARGRFGTITGDVPATERYFGGGTSSHRGFTARQLSPFVRSTQAPFPYVPIGGAGLLEVSAELRIPSYFKFLGLPISSVVFLDGGDVTFAASDLDPTNLHWATGFGLRVVTPVGPVGLDVGFRLNRTVHDPEMLNPVAGHHVNWLLAVGEAF
ncbi:MAG TPA: BamA/TamA family outer membrane protein, partial [Kofleriaceae bacterium]|nr:BamA/TamA family outer membrane protein [Kofleriaceae bacterium]